MVKIRLRRMGARQKPFYRIVVADSRAPRDGRFIEAIGTYDPNTDPPAVKVNTERAQYWLNNGAQPTDIARALLKIAGFFGGVTEKAEKKAESKKKAGKAAKEAKEAEATAQETPVAEEAPADESVAQSSPNTEATEGVEE